MNKNNKMESFQVTLPSNSSSKTFPSNRAGQYETELMSPLHLEGPWEVAVVDVMYPHSWNNLSTTVTMFIEYGELKDALFTPKFSTTFKITPQYFLNPEVFCHRLNKWCMIKSGVKKEKPDDDANLFRFAYDPVDDRITMTSDVLTNDNIIVNLCFDDKAAIERMLGIDAQTIYPIEDKEWQVIGLRKTDPKLTGIRPPEFERFPLMFVYSDLIQYQLIGDIKAPILSVLPVTGWPGEQIYWNFNPQTYIALNKSDIRTIAIRLCTENGQTFPFIGNGKVICRLNFRRRLV